MSIPNLFPSNVTTSLNSEVRIFTKGLYISVLMLISVLTVIVNILTVLTIWRTRKLRTISNMFVTSLAVGDLLFGILMPVGMFVRIRVSQSLLNNHKYLCHMAMMTFVYLNAHSFTTITLIGVERFIYIVHPYKYPTLVTKIKVLFGISFTWIVGIPINVVVMDSLQWKGRCSSDSKMNLVIVRTLMGMYLFLAIVVGVMYSYITYVAFKHMHSIHVRIQGGSVNSLRRSSFKAVKLFAAVYSLFMFCWIPFFALNSVGTALSRSIGNIFGFLSSCLNFCVYVLMNPAFRTGVRNLCLSIVHSNGVADSFVRT